MSFACYITFVFPKKLSGAGQGLCNIFEIPQRRVKSIYTFISLCIDILNDSTNERNKIIHWYMQIIE